MLVPFIHADSIAKAPKVPVGQINQKKLKCVDFEIIGNTIGEKIKQGTYGGIFEVKKENCIKPRIYKIIQSDQFKNGNEIRISKMTGKLGVAPAFHQALLVEQFIVIEMDYEGKSLGQVMEDLGEGDGERASLEEVLSRKYANPEVFYFDLFNKIKILNENKISYTDVNGGNLLVNDCTENSLLLIDYDGADIHENVNAAVKTSLTSMYVITLFNQFVKLKNLSEDSRQLINWFRSNAHLLK